MIRKARSFGKGLMVVLGPRATREGGTTRVANEDSIRAGETLEPS